MAVQISISGTGWFVNHQEYLDQLYSGVATCKRGLFDINTPFMMDLQAHKLADQLETPDMKTRKRKKSNKKTLTNVDLKLKQALEEFTSHSKFCKTSPGLNLIRANNKPARELANQLTNLPCVKGPLEGKNDASQPQIVTIQERQYVLPPKSEYKVLDMGQFVDSVANRTFDLIIMDPPWENKHVKRSRDSYNMVTNESIKQLPVNQLLDKNGYLVVWVTNSSRHLLAVEEWLDHWNLTKCAELYWLKVTNYGQPICPFDHPHKKPYETIVIASHSINKMPTGQTVVSVPCAVHSHKPCLLKVLEHLDIGTDNALELFGRYLLPNCTTMGNQALKLQDLEYFDRQ